MENKDGVSQLRGLIVCVSRGERVQGAWRAEPNCARVLLTRSHSARVSPWGLKPGRREAAFLPKGPSITCLHRRTGMKGMPKVRSRDAREGRDMASSVEVVLFSDWMVSRLSQIRRRYASETC